MFILFKKTKKEDRSDTVLVGLGFITSLYFTTACNETGCLLKNQQITFILANNFSLFRSNLGTQSLSTEEKTISSILDTTEYDSSIQHATPDGEKIMIRHNEREH